MTACWAELVISGSGIQGLCCRILQKHWGGIFKVRALLMRKYKRRNAAGRLDDWKGLSRFFVLQSSMLNMSRSNISRIYKLMCWKRLVTRQGFGCSQPTSLPSASSHGGESQQPYHHITRIIIVVALTNHQPNHADHHDNHNRHHHQHHTSPLNINVKASPCNKSKKLYQEEVAPVSVLVGAII